MDTMPLRKQLPLVDLGVLRELEQQAGDATVAQSFVRDFIQIWNHRFTRLEQAVEVGDMEARMDAILSVKASSSMAGAARLAHLAAGLERLIRNGDIGAAALLPGIRTCGEQTIEEFLSCYVIPST
ncbi:Hpt domain-containing protein [Arthrobacter sp. H14]|uniref:Hpt domain-containing protein n=1 Tax=Arthrobacter sp. H14 TaxID=1312959 RepID=UPI0004AFAA7B|nr:Hpt domain-containing protein [Arthrobacter sp. H14]